MDALTPELRARRDSWSLAGRCWYAAIAASLIDCDDALATLLTRLFGAPDKVKAAIEIARCGVCIEGVESCFVRLFADEVLMITVPAGNSTFLDSGLWSEEEN